MTAHFGDLFGSPFVTGFSSAPDFVTPAEERELIARIDATELEPFKFQNWLGKRLTASFGSRYDFERGRMAAAPPIPDWLLPFRDRVARFARLEPDDLVQALLIRYDPVPASAGIATGRYTSMSSVSRLARPPCCGCADAGQRASTAPRRRSSPVRSITLRARCGTHGSTASSRWSDRAGRSLSAPWHPANPLDELFAQAEHKGNK